MNGSVLMITFFSPDPKGNQGTFVPIYRKPWGRKEWKATPSLWARMFYLQMPETTSKKQITNEASYLCVKVAEPSYSSYTLGKVFTTPTTHLNHFSVILPFLMGLLTALLRGSYNSAGIIKGLTNVHTALVGHWATELHILLVFP